MIDLLANIGKIHTTTLGEIRIRRNLALEIENVANWCSNQIKNVDNIIRNGKNWYVYKRNNIITVNANSYTIITAHKITGKRKYSE